MTLYYQIINFLSVMMAAEKQQEAVMLDMLSVISHHRARLATPIRTMQKVYTDADMDNIPFSETIFNRGGAAVNRPLLLIDVPQRINGDGKAKPRTTTPRSDDEQTKNTAASEPPRSNEEQTKNASSPESPRANEEQAKTTVASGPRPNTVTEGTPQSNAEKQQEKKQQQSKPVEVATPTVKNESEKAPASASRPIFEDNIVLGVALEGAKRTLPIEEGIETSEMAGSRSGNSGSSPSNVKDRKGLMPPEPTTK